MTLAQTAILAVCVWAATGWIPKWPSRRDDIRSMLQFGGTVSLNSLVSYATYNVEKVLLGRYWGVEALGLYGRAYQLVNLPTDLLNTSVGSVAFPALSRLQDDPVRVRAYFLKGYSLVLALTLPLTIACALFAPDVILVLLGPKWNGTATIFRLLAPTILVFALINPFAWLLFSLGMVGRSLKTALVMSPIVVIAYVVGLPYGPTGLALAYSVAMVLWIVPHVLWCIHGTMIAPRDLLKAAGRILLSAGVASIVGLTVQVACRSLSWPVLRLMLGASALAISYLWMLLIVMRQKDLYLDLLLSLTRRPAVGNSP
jgi:PST family polysaccharide transporter